MPDSISQAEKYFMTAFDLKRRDQKRIFILYQFWIKVFPEVFPE